MKYLFLFWLVPCALIAQRQPYFQKCRGQSDGNIAQFSIQNVLPEGATSCNLDACDTYYLRALEVTGACVTHIWLLDQQNLEAPDKHALCRPFVPETKHKITHKVRIEEGTTVREETATCTFEVPKCCEMNLDINLVSTIPTNIHNECAVTLVPTLIPSQNQVNWLVETAKNTIYQGNDFPSSPLRVPCQNPGDRLCITATNQEGCEATNCVFLGQVPSNKGGIFEAKVESVMKDLNMACFPNPAGNILFVNTSFLGEQEGNLRIMNSIGQSVFTASVASGMQQKEIDVSRFQSGTYFINMADGNGNFINQKFVIVH